MTPAVRKTSRAPYRPVTPAWCAAVKVALLEAGKDQRWLAAAVGAEEATISALLKGKVKSSSFVDAISARVGIPLPEYGDKDSQDLALNLQTIRDKNPAMYRTILEMVASTLTALDPAKSKK